MLSTESWESVFANVMPLASGVTASNNGGGGGGERRQPGMTTVVASRNSRFFCKGRQYSVKTLVLLCAGLLLTAGGACREQAIDQGALLTARTVGLEHLQRGRLPDAEREFRKVIALAPRDPLGYANLGLTYLRAGRFSDAESQLKRARRLDPASPEIALITAKLYSLTARTAEARQMLATIPADARVLYALALLERQSGDSDADRRYAERLRQVLERSPANLAVRLKLAATLLTLDGADSTIRYLEDVRASRPEPPREAKQQLGAALQALRAGRLTEAHAALDRLLRLIETTAPYQASLAQVDWIEGPLAGRPVLEFSPQSLITMRGITPAAGANAAVRFTDVTGESGLPDLGRGPTALALGDYDGDGEDNLLVAAPLPRLYAVHGGYVADVSGRTPLPLPAGAVSATFADYDNDGWLDLFVIGTDGRGYLLHNREGKGFEDVTAAAGVRAVAGVRHALFVDVDHDGDLDLLLVGGGSLAVYRNNLDGTFTLFPNADGITRGGSDAAFGDFDDDGRTDIFVASENGGDVLFHNDGLRGFRDSGLGHARAPLRLATTTTTGRSMSHSPGLEAQSFGTTTAPEDSPSRSAWVVDRVSRSSTTTMTAGSTSSSRGRTARRCSITTAVAALSIAARCCRLRCSTIRRGQCSSPISIATVIRTLSSAPETASTCFATTAGTRTWACGCS